MNINSSTKELLDQTIKKYSIALEDYRIFIRPSGTEPLLRILVEANNQNKVNHLSREITSKLTTEINKISNTL